MFKKTSFWLALIGTIIGIVAFLVSLTSLFHREPINSANKQLEIIIGALVLWFTGIFTEFAFNHEISKETKDSTNDLLNKISSLEKSMDLINQYNQFQWRKKIIDGFLEISNNAEKSIHLRNHIEEKTIDFLKSLQEGIFSGIKIDYS